MAALAETLVDEWLNRQGFFTVRGLKHGVDEVDLLGVRPVSKGLEAWHVEVQASFRPIGYISPLTKQLASALGVSRTSAKARDPETVELCAKAWITSKYLAGGKVRAREVAWPNLRWHFVFVHGVVRAKRELELIAEAGIMVIPLYDVLRSLKHKRGAANRGGAGTDLAEIIEYYNARLDP